MQSRILSKTISAFLHNLSMRSGVLLALNECTKPTNWPTFSENETRDLSAELEASAEVDALLSALSLAFISVSFSYIPNVHLKMITFK